eukprot:5029253-Pyramimonas_sp.AAC.1
MADYCPRLLVGYPRQSGRRTPPLQSSASFAVSPHPHLGRVRLQQAIPRNSMASSRGVVFSSSARPA